MEANALGPAERIIQTLLNPTDHMVHNRPGMITPDQRTKIGVRWEPVFYKEEDGKKVVYKKPKKQKPQKVGVLWADNTIRDDRRKIADYQPAGLFSAVAVWMYQQIAEVWQMDNEFAARWASFQFPQEHRDLKVALAAFMLVQSRKGEEIRDGDDVITDEDYRDVGEAMILIRRPDGKDLNPKLLLRIYYLLNLPEIAEINRKLGFGRSLRKPFLGRWARAVTLWLRYREHNPKMLEGLVKAGYKRTVMELCRKVGYKPETPKFFQTLGWKQAQSKAGHRTIAIGEEVQKDSWEGKTEEQICEAIIQEKLNYKRVVGMLPQGMTPTRAIMAATIEAGGMSEKDIIIHAPTLEELGLLNVQEIKERLDKALKNAEDMRAANIATRMKSKENQEKLQQGADAALQKVAEEVTKGIQVYFMVDRSGSMTVAIEEAKALLKKFLQGFPLDKTKVFQFNTVAREVKIKASSSVAIEAAFRGIHGSGGTNYGCAVAEASKFPPKEDEDVLFIFVGDEEQYGTFTDFVRASNLNPMAFGLLKVGGTPHYRVVAQTAAECGIPCFEIDKDTFSDVYAIPRIIRNLVASTPVGRPMRASVPRVSLIEQIIKTDLLQKPAWAIAA